MTSIASRIAKLEQARQQQSAANTTPVFFVITNDRGDRDKPLEVRHDGRIWTQGAKEPKEVFKARVIKDALATFKPKSRLQALYLHARHPSLGQEKWLAKHGLPSA